MPFWNQKEGREVESAREEAESALPAGWRIDYADYEKFAIPGGTVRTHPHRRDLPTAEGWAPPTPF